MYLSFKELIEALALDLFEQPRDEAVMSFYKNTDSDDNETYGYSILDCPSNVNDNLRGKPIRSEIPGQVIVNYVTHTHNDCAIDLQLKLMKQRISNLLEK